jgi:hypothetical protein
VFLVADIPCIFHPFNQGQYHFSYIGGIFLTLILQMSGAINDIQQGKWIVWPCRLDVYKRHTLDGCTIPKDCQAKNINLQK